MQILSEGPFASFEDGDEFFTKLRQSIEKEGLKLKQRLFSLFWNRDTVRSFTAVFWGPANSHGPVCLGL